jgi:transcriptional regulator with XRE-family HTH domain
MTSVLPPIPEHSLSVQKRRAVLKVVDQLRRAFFEATDRYGLSKKDFADRIGMKPSQLTRILNGRQNVSVGTAEAVLRALQARSEFSYVFLEDIEPANTNRAIVSKYKKTDAAASKPKDKLSQTIEYE